MENIREIVMKYPYIAMDTEFPGVVVRPVGNDIMGDLPYQTLRANCDLLKLIQLGLSFTDENGNFPDGCACWQLNFKFDLNEDIHAEDSIELLKQSGIDFNKFEKFGIDVQYFGELLMMSGLVLNDEVKWLSFSSSYDFGYLLKTLTCSELPQDEHTFMTLLHEYFPKLFDIKYAMSSANVYGGLSYLAEQLQVARIGPIHQAGSDSLLTSQTYFAFMLKHFPGPDQEERFQGQLFGLGSSSNKNRSQQSGNNSQGNSLYRQNSGSGSGYSSFGHVSESVSYNGGGSSTYTEASYDDGR